MAVCWRAESFGRAETGTDPSRFRTAVTTSGSVRRCESLRVWDFNSTTSDERCRPEVPGCERKGISLQEGSLKVRYLVAFGVLYLQPGVCSAKAGRRSENERER